jgi:Na+/H+ antiporter NhaD/arsenite permease-like protein
MNPTMRTLRRLLSIAALSAACGAAQAAEIDGAALSMIWALPFAGILLSIALFPLFAPHFWHHHYGKVALAWAAAFMLPFALTYGAGAAGAALVHAALAEYVPFIILLTALFTVAGGIHIRGNFHGSPAFNCGLLLLGAVLASFMGTTGASMLLIRPLIRANDNRQHNAHVVVFFIFIVSNIGGSLTPLGDPPLFLGFLKGIEFFWTAKTLFPETLFLTAALLAIFYVIDSHYYRKEGITRADPTPDSATFAIEGRANLLLLAAIMGLVLMSGTWKPGIEFNVFGTPVGLPQIVRDAALIAVAIVSFKLTPKLVHQRNEFGWEPMLEVAKLFAGIFLTIVPVLAMLKAGMGGAFAPVVALVNTPDGQPIPAMYFWATGMLSGFLDNAPTYLVFFNLAGGDPQVLMTKLAPVLAAVSAGAVFMGALSYIGNAPNLMVKAIAEHQGVKMPSFFGYMAWSCAILLPLFAVVTLIWFR